MDMYTLPYFKWITNKDLLYSTWNSAQCFVAGWMGGEFGGERMHEDVWLRTRSFGPFRPTVLKTIFWEETLGKASLSIYSRRTGKPSICDTDRGLQTQGVCTSEESILLKLTPWRSLMSLLELKKKGGAVKTKQYNGNGQAEKGIGRFIPSLVLRAFIRKPQWTLHRALEGGKKKLKTASRDELV